jgi:hypothetical protein
MALTEPTIAELNKKVDERHEEVSARLEQLSVGMNEIRQLILSRKNDEEQHSSHRSQPYKGNRQDGPHQHYATRISKIDFPKFDGKKMKEWLYKCDQFFALDATPDDSRVRLASIHLEGHALQWHVNYMKSKFNTYPSWTEYVIDVTQRFGEVFEDPLAELIHVKQTGSVQEYIDAFELASTQVNLFPEQSLSIFLARLENTTQMHVRMFHPTSVIHAGRLAKFHEASKLSSNSQKFQNKTNSFTYNKTAISPPKPLLSTPVLNTNLTPSTNKSSIQKPTRIYSPAEMSERKAKGLCMYCDEPYTPGHQFKHKRTQIMVMELDNDASAPEINEETTVDNSVGTEPQGEEIQLSLHALTGLPSYQTMKVCGSHNQKTLQILLDSGSTHNFLDLEVAKRLGCKLEPVTPMTVTAGGGNKIQAPFICRNFSCQLQQTTFLVDVVVLPLGCYDLILGIPFLKALGPILWDFNTLQMEFKFNGKRFVLRGAKPSSIKVVSNKSFNHTLQQGAQLCYLSVDIIQSEPATCFQLQMAETLPLEIVHLLNTYADLFESPKGLPPPRPGFDHQLPLKEGTTPFNIRPYRYSSVQKDIVDGLVEEMMEKGWIQHSNSPFASPVVLVRKKGGQWRLCVDYRRLNQATIKDKFPIPLIDDLMDELGGSVIYSKLDLQSGYHQMRMAAGEEYKTAFKTHAGHFEYLVMPFGLTNAPASFQALMNRIFQQYLRKFVIIFFDDILIYSPSIEAHVTHLDKVFQVLRENQLFLRKEKCSFATNKVEYLGHFITKEGVSTDPNKIQAVSSWPLPSSIKQLRGFLGLAGIIGDLCGILVKFPNL